MIRRWLALTYYLYALRLAALSHFYFNRLYFKTAVLSSVLQGAATNLRFLPHFPSNRHINLNHKNTMPA